MMKTWKIVSETRETDMTTARGALKNYTCRNLKETWNIVIVDTGV